jgi:hypothetical protein
MSAGGLRQSARATSAVAAYKAVNAKIQTTNRRRCCVMAAARTAPASSSAVQAGNGTGIASVRKATVHVAQQAGRQVTQCYTVPRKAFVMVRRCGEGETTAVSASITIRPAYVRAGERWRSERQHVSVRGAA